MQSIIYAETFGVVADSNGTSGNGTDNTLALRDLYNHVIALVTSVTSQDWVIPRIIFPAGCIRFTDWIFNTPNAAGAAVNPIYGLEQWGQGRRSTEFFFDKVSVATEDPRLNTAFILGNRALGWSFHKMSFRSLDPDNSLFYLWSRDTDDSVLAFPEFGKGNQSDFEFSNVEWRGAWKRVIGIGGDHQANVNSEITMDRCSISNDATASDAFFHIGMPMYGAVHMRVTAGATGGTFTIKVGANTTAPIAYNATAATIQTAITGLASVGAGNATVTAVSDGFLIRFLNAIEAVDTTTVIITTALTGGGSMILYRRPIQQSQFLNYWFTRCRFEVGGGVVLRVGRGGNINCRDGSYIAVGAGNVTFFKLEDENSHAESTCRLLVSGVRFEMRNANHKVIDCKWNKGYIKFESCMDSAFSFSAFATTLAAHSYDFTTQGLSRGPQIVYDNCELIGLHAFTTHATTAVTGGSVSYRDSRFMNNTVATGTAAGIARYTGVAIPYASEYNHTSSLLRIANSSFGW